MATLGAKPLPGDFTAAGRRGNHGARWLSHTFLSAAVEGIIRKPSHSALRCICATAPSSVPLVLGVASHARRRATACWVKAFSWARGICGGASRPSWRESATKGDSRSWSRRPAIAAFTSSWVTDHTQHCPLATMALRFCASSRTQCWWSAQPSQNTAMGLRLAVADHGQMTKSGLLQVVRFNNGPNSHCGSMR
jgi:hypothetical protein